MSGKPTRGVFQVIFKHFINSLKPRRFRGDLIGTDHLGNKYYETPRHANSDKKNSARYFEPQDKDKFDQEVPAEWEAWLRYRRKEPPSESEVLRNVAIMITKKKNAAELDNALEASRPRTHKAEPITGSKGFPVYKDYQDTEPGRSKNSTD